MVAIPALASSGVVGIQWFASDTVLGWQAVVPVAAGFGAVVGAIAAAGARRALLTPLTARHGEVTVRVLPRLIVLAAGAGVMGTFGGYVTSRIAISPRASWHSSPWEGCFCSLWVPLLVSRPPWFVSESSFHAGRES